MPKTFHIPLLNSSRWMDNTASFDPRDAPTFDQTTDNNNYRGKWKTIDIETGQLYSDYLPLLYYVNCATGAIINVTLTPIATSIVGETFTVYEWATDFSTFPPGSYNGYFEYTDDNGDLQQWTTVIRVQNEYRDNKGEYTLRIAYKNTENVQNVVWDTGIEFNIRIEALLRKFDPKAAIENYDDQYYEGYTENGIPYRWRTMVMGTGLSVQLPDWLFDKVNRIFTQDNVKVNGVNHVATGSDGVKITRPEVGRNEDGTGELVLQEVSDFDYRRFKTGPPPDEEYIVIQRVYPFENETTSFSIAGIIKADVNFVGVAIKNNLLTQNFQIKIGITPGGGEYVNTIMGVPDQSGNARATEWFGIWDYFVTPATIYITVPSGVSISGRIDYKKYDAASSIPPAITSPFVEGIPYPYIDEVEFENDFDLATGLGIRGVYVGCGLMDGRNTRFDLRNATLKGIPDTTVNTVLNTPVGSDDIQLTKGQLPAEGIFIASNEIDPTPDPGNQLTPTTTMNKGRNPGSTGYLLSGIPSSAERATVGLTSDLGDGDDINIVSQSVFVAWFTKLP